MNPASGGPSAQERFAGDPEAWLADLCADLRDEGLSTSLSESILARQCVGALDDNDVLDLFHGLRAAFCGRQADLEVFDRCFWARWQQTLRPSGSPVMRVGESPSAAGSPRPNRLGETERSDPEHSPPTESPEPGTALL